MISGYDICNFTRVAVTSTYLYFGGICDIFWYHRHSEMYFSPDYLNIGTVKAHEIASPWDYLHSLWI